MSITFFTNYSTYFEGDSTSFDQTGYPSLIWVYVEATSTNPYYDYYSFGVSGDNFDSSDWVYRPADWYTSSDAIANNRLTADFPNNFGFYIKPSSDGVTEGTQSLTITAYYDRQKTMEVSSITINIADDNSGDDNIETFYQYHPVTLYGGLGSDTIKGNIKSDFLYGNEGNDIITGGLGNDEIYGGDGNDTAIFGDVDNTINLGIISIQDTGEGWDYLSSIENVNAGDGNDIIRGNSINNYLYGENDNDKLFGRGGADTLIGGEGNDKLIGGGGRDTAIFGSGNNRIDLANANRQNTREGRDLFSSIENVKGGDGNDYIYGDGINNYLYGENNNDRLYGRAGNDRLYGEAGNDRLYGEAGNDILFGGSGNDLLTGGLGNDQLTGGAGRDKFSINTGTGRDVITDYTSGEDKIKLLGGLTESDLTIRQAGENVKIKYEEDLLAIVQNTIADDLTFI
jgi:Ca2+-binding RTX toxin-like protein